MKNRFSFDEHIAEYEKWYDEHEFVFRSELEAIREMLPAGDKLTGIEVGVGTGRFSRALGIKEGVDPSPGMRSLAIERGIEVVDGMAERLPYGDHRFDFVVLNFCISYLNDVGMALEEAYRVLKQDGVFIVGFLDKDSTIGRDYISRKADSTFYRHANFYGPERIADLLRKTGFRHLSYRQTLFGRIDEIAEVQPSIPGHGEGSYVVIKATKTPAAQLR